jgi:hypothetical protein
MSLLASFLGAFLAVTASSLPSRKTLIFVHSMVRV